MEKKLIINEPKRFFSYLDEKSFFGWLNEIEFISSVKGIDNWRLELTLMHPIDEKNIRDLISIMMRYQIDMRCIGELCNNDNESWLKNPDMYWYKMVFD